MAFGINATLDVFKFSRRSSALELHAWKTIKHSRNLGGMDGERHYDGGELFSPFLHSKARPAPHTTYWTTCWRVVRSNANFITSVELMDRRGRNWVWAEQEPETALRAIFRVCVEKCSMKGVCPT